ncbi:hypothetical protein PBCV1_a587R [Paramecium bursaria Chlorella virus 1]|uniref:Uncharacterized protein n=1 Tax=Paramecium bursaria Chlorella virus 1 TaxID=10506 RepID=O41069_PBCV1|nr:hypothetical protein PBCV1_a587R [Paramecium bursaria Chlorella virus 1]AAC97013.2 hypothetical protein [Paramecium bursaria Chlorella virus 1]
MEKVHDKTRNVSSVNIRVGHDHHMTVSQRRSVFVHFTGLKAQNLFERGDFFVLCDTCHRCIANVQQLTAERKNTISLATDHGQSCNCKCCCGISLRQDESTHLTMICARPCSIV